MSKRDYDSFNEDELDNQLLSLKAKKPKKDFYTESDFEDEYDEDLFKDEKDREYLNSLGEVEREETLLKRFEKREELKNRKKIAIAKGLFISKKEESDMKKNKKLKQKSALSDLKERRERQKRRNLSPQHKKIESQENVEEQQTVEDDEEENYEVKLSIEDINLVYVTRYQLEKWFSEPYFEKIIIGTFVKVLIGEIEGGIRSYRLAQVDSLKKKREYPFGKGKTQKHLVLSHAGTVKAFSMERISNQPISPFEFNYWKQEMEKNRKVAPLIVDLRKKNKELKEIHSYTYSSKDINKRIRENVKFSSLPLVSLNTQKMSLENEKSILEMKGDNESEEYFSICSDLERVEREIRRKSAQPKSETSIMIINKKNKELNRNRKVKQTKKDASKLDPFARQRTQSSLFLGLAGDNKLQKKEEVKVVKEVNLTPAAVLEKKHDFEIDLSTIDELTKITTDKTPLPIQKPTPIPPKKLDTSAKKSLSLSDYKKRRGLIQ